jgi:hypothetical protein
LFEFAPVEDRKVVAGFDGGTMTSNAGGLLLGGADKAMKLIERVAKCFVDRRDPSLIEHSVATLVGQRIFGLAFGYEDLNDHDALRHDRLFAVLASKLKARRADCAPRFTRSNCAPTPKPRMQFSYVELLTCLEMQRGGNFVPSQAGSTLQTPKPPSPPPKP